MLNRIMVGGWLKPGLILIGMVGVLLTACGGGGADGVGQKPDDKGPVPVSLAAPGTAVVKLRAEGNTWVAMAETLQRIDNIFRPQRRLLIATDGVSPGSTYLPPSGWSLVDFTVHPSRQISLVLATDTALRLVRLDAQGGAMASEDFVDPLAANDPYLSDLLYIRNRQSMVPWSTRDAVRVAAVGDDAVLVLRSGLNAVVAYRLAFGAATGYRKAWRTVVEPGVNIGNGGQLGGTFDPFYGLDNQWRLAIDVDQTGRVAVAVGTARTELAEGHAEHFNEPYHDSASGVVLVTELAANGLRLGTSAIVQSRRSEVHAVKWIGDSVAVGGRVMSESRPDGSGWDAHLTIVRPALGGSRPAATIDIDRGDVVLDIAALADGQILVAGSSGYLQNPAGASISEEAAPLLAVLDAQGRLVRRVAVGAGPRHNQLRTLAKYRGGWLAGGLENGPGTHSADANPALLFADGYVRAIRAD